MNNNKPKPIIEKFDLTPQEQKDIQQILSGKPTEEQIQKHREWSPVETEVWVKHRVPLTPGTRRELIRKKYFRNGKCMICHEFPLYRVMYPMDGVILVQYFCQDHLPNELIE